MSAEQTCPQCGQSFVCGMAASDSRCWCADLPPLPQAPEPGLGCLCPSCLKERLAIHNQTAD